MIKWSLILIVVVVLLGADLVQAERLSVTANIANIRSGPNSDDPVIWQVERYHPLNIIQKKDGWDLFEDFEGDRGWIHASLLADIYTVVVKRDNCNVRSGPGTDSDILFTVDKGVPFKVLEENQQWLRIVHADGDQGWIHRSLVW
ncbi:MAG: SH3 domain-containing protein [Desulfosarcina sp.]